jgi:hypothetical protein
VDAQAGVITTSPGTSCSSYASLPATRATIRRSAGASRYSTSSLSCGERKRQPRENLAAVGPPPPNGTATCGTGAP